MGFQYARVVCLLFLMSVAVFFDIKERRIPNWLIGCTLIVSLGMQIWFGVVWMWAAGIAIGFAMFIPGYAFRQMGAGDVKLMAAAGSVFGIKAFAVGLAVYMIGAAYALIWTFLQQGGGVGWRNANMKCRLSSIASEMIVKSGDPLSDESLSRTKPKNAPMPYSLPIAIATILGLWLF
jgi:prepilin peptidase CpaA